MKENSLFSSSVLRFAEPAFLDLPWHLHLEHWEGHCTRLEYVPKGNSRHTVVFVNYDGNLYALKELPEGIAEKEYHALLKMEEMKLPVVRAIGYLETNPSNEKCSVLITRHLERSLPYQTLFAKRVLDEKHDMLLDAMAGLLVQLHLAGIFWGDCSLANTLFRRDAGALQAYLVDAETAELNSTISNGMREYDLDIMEENVGGAVADIDAMIGQNESRASENIGHYIRSRYETLWHEITHEEFVSVDEGWKIQQRIKKLNDLGFSIREVSLFGNNIEGQLRVKTIIADRNYHRNLLHSLTGIDAEELQARMLINEIQQHRMMLTDMQSRDVSLNAAAFHWQLEVYKQLSDRMTDPNDDPSKRVDAYCALLEHKWYLSEKAQRDVGTEAAIQDYLQKYK